MQSNIITNKALWDSFVASQTQAQFLQSWEWGEFQQALHRPIFRLGIQREHKLVAAVFGFIRNHGLGIRSLTIYRGPMLDVQLPVVDYLELHAQLLRDVLELAKKEGVTHLHIEPATDITSPITRKFETHQWIPISPDQPKAHWLLSLRPSLETLQSAQLPKTRYNINLAERKGVRTDQVPWEKGLEEFLKLTHSTAIRKGISPHPDSYFRAMAQTLAPLGFLHFTIASLDKTALVANIMLQFGGTATYAHGASADAARNVMAPHLLQWKQITDAKERGFHWYDFGGVAPAEAGESHPWFGISRFKRGFGGEEHLYFGAVEQPIKKLQYKVVQLRRMLRK